MFISTDGLPSPTHITTITITITTTTTGIEEASMWPRRRTIATSVVVHLARGMETTTITTTTTTMGMDITRDTVAATETR